MKLAFTDKKQFLVSIRKLAQVQHVSPQIMLQEVALDDLLDRIAVSKYRDNLVLKGGFLIASLLGVDTRSTRDIDTSVVGLPVSEAKMIAVFTEICGVQLPNDLIQFRIMGLKEIRKNADYRGYRLHIRAKIFASLVDTKVDISTGDVITERAIQYGHQLLLENRKINVLAYNIETIIAEKIQTIVSRGTLNTRLKDFYDIFMLHAKKINEINLEILRQAIIATAKNRHDSDLNHYVEHLQMLKKDSGLKNLWTKYQLENSYAQGIRFENTCQAAIDLIQKTGLG